MNAPIKDPAESVVLEFDFSSELDGIDSATIALSVVGSTADPAVATMLQGAHQISGRKVLQRVRNGVPGARYKARATAVRGDDVIVRAGVISVRTA